jgi:nucleoid DNA-binding protein
VRPFENRGASGIIPKVKINYTDIGVISGKSKDFCRNAVEKVIRDLSDKAKKGENLTVEIPHLGSFLVRNKIAAVSFDHEINEDTRGVTAKNYQNGNLFSSSNTKHNMQQIAHNKKIGMNSGRPLTAVALHRQTALGISPDGEEWLRNNLDINTSNIQNNEQALSRTASARPASAKDQQN